MRIKKLQLLDYQCTLLGYGVQIIISHCKRSLQVAIASGSGTSGGAVILLVSIGTAIAPLRTLQQCPCIAQESQSCNCTANLRKLEGGIAFTS